MTDERWTGSSTPYLDADQGDAWQQEAASKGRTGGQRILEAGEETAPADVSIALGLPPGTPVVGRKRLILLDEQPVELACSYWPIDVAAGTPLGEPRKIKGGAVSLLASLGRTPASVDERISARPPTPEEQQTLELTDEHEWVLTLTRVIHSSDGRPYEASIMIMPGRIGRLNYSMKVD